MMNRRTVIGLLAGIVGAFCGSASLGQEEAPQADPNNPAAKPAPATTQAAPATRAARPRVVFEIEYGRRESGQVVIELYEAKAPETVMNFLRYVDEGFYDRTIFHRVLPQFVVQGGGYRNIRQRQTQGIRPPIKNEANNGLKNTRGTVAMARSKDPHSANSQFFINVVENPKLDYPGHDGWGYCVFGRVVEGMDVIDKIKELPCRVPPDLQRAYIKARRGNPNAPHPERSQPLSPPKLVKAYRLPEAEETQPTSAPVAVPPEEAAAEPSPSEPPEDVPPDEPPLEPDELAPEDRDDDTPPEESEEPRRNAGPAEDRER
jgi:cyclophilin family peptidyl-prolyl cis-trans isomerase